MIGDLVLSRVDIEFDRLDSNGTFSPQAMLAALQKVLETVGGGRYLLHAQFHPMHSKRQHRFTGRTALGLDPVG